MPEHGKGVAQKRAGEDALKCAHECQFAHALLGRPVGKVAVRAIDVTKWRCLDNQQLNNGTASRDWIHRRLRIVFLKVGKVKKLYEMRSGVWGSTGILGPSHDPFSNRFNPLRDRQTRRRGIRRRRRCRLANVAAKQGQHKRANNAGCWTEAERVEFGAAHFPISATRHIFIFCWVHDWATLPNVGASGQPKFA